MSGDSTRVDEEDGERRGETHASQPPLLSALKILIDSSSPDERLMAANVLAYASAAEMRAAFMSFFQSVDGQAALHGIQIDPKVLAAIRSEAARVFGSIDRADRWLCSAPFAGEAPRLYLLMSPTGIEEIYDVLNRIDHGVYS